MGRPPIALLGLASLAWALWMLGCANAPAPTTTVAAGEIYVDVYDAAKCCNGTTLFADVHDDQALRVVNVDMRGTILWEYVVPADVKQGAAIGLDSEWLANGNVLIVLSGVGIYEITPSGNVAWSHADPDCSHDADRLANGNTIYIFGNNDTKQDNQVKEVDTAGNLVWSWSAREAYDRAPYADIANGGWTHANAVTRMANGNTLVNLRNFGLTVEVNPAGEVVWEYDWNALYDVTPNNGFDPHEPELQPDGGLLVCLQKNSPYQVVEIDRATGAVKWEYAYADLRTARDCDRLPNGNTLIVGVVASTDDSVILEVTPAGQTVWQLKLKDTPATGSPGFFYKAERVCSGA